MENPPTAVRRAFPFLAASVAAKPVGFLKEVLVAACFGSGAGRDAFLIAWQIPNMIGSFLMEGLPQLLAPYLAETRKKEAHQRLLGGLVGVLLAAFLLLTLLVFVWAGPLVRLVAPFATEAIHGLSASLLRVLAFTVVLMGAGAVLTAFLLLRNKLVLTALSITLMNVAVMATVWAGHRAHGIHALAYGTLIGMAVMAVFLYLGERGIPIAPQSFRYHEHRSFFGAGGSFFLGTVVFNVCALVEKVFASTLPPGNLSNLDYAFRIVQVAFSLFSVIPTFLFPRLCETAAAADSREDFNALVAKGIRATLLLTLPAAGVLWVLRQPVIELVFQRGAFSLEAARSTALLMGVYGLGLPAHCLNNVLIHVFYARRDTRVRVAYSLLFLAAIVAANLVLIPRLGAPAIALANGAAAVLSATFLLAAVKRKIGLAVGAFLPTLWKSAVTAAILAPLAHLTWQAAPGPSVVRLALAACLAGAGFLGLAKGLKIEGSAYVWEFLRLARAKP